MRIYYSGGGGLNWSPEVRERVDVMLTKEKMREGNKQHLERLENITSERSKGHLIVYYSGDTKFGAHPEDVLEDTSIMLTKEKLRQENRSQFKRLDKLEEERAK